MSHPDAPKPRLAGGSNTSRLPRVYVVILALLILLLPARAEADTPSPTRTLLGPGFGASISGDGGLVAYNDNYGAQVYVRDMHSGITTLASRTPSGTPAQLDGGYLSGGLADVSRDGHYVSFTSNGNNLVPGDTNQVEDVFVFNTRTEDVSLISSAADGGTGNGESDQSAISADGRYVAFLSLAGNLIDPRGAPTTTSGPGVRFKLFLRDRATGITSLLTDQIDGIAGKQKAIAISDDGRYVVFTTGTSLLPGDTNGEPDLYRIDAATHTLARAEPPTGWTTLYESLSIAPDGDLATFTAAPLEPSNECCESVYTYRFSTGLTNLISRNSEGHPGNFGSMNGVIAGDGTKIGLLSAASDIQADPDDDGLGTDVFLAPATGGLSTEVTPLDEGRYADLDISDDARQLVTTRFDSSGDYQVAYLSYPPSSSGPGTVEQPPTLPVESQLPLPPPASPIDTPPTPPATFKCQLGSGRLGPKILASLKCGVRQFLLPAKCGSDFATSVVAPLEGLKVAKTARGLIVVSKVRGAAAKAAARFYNAVVEATYVKSAPKGFRSGPEAYATLRRIKKIASRVKQAATLSTDLIELARSVSAKSFNKIIDDLIDIAGVKSCVSGLTAAILNQ